MSVSLEQPMREAEIDLIELANANETAIAQEVQDRISAGTTLQSNIDAEASAREAADTTLTNNLASEVSTREAQYTQLHSDIEDTNSTVSELGNSLDTLNTTVGSIGDRVTTVEGKFPVATADIADGAVTEDKLAASAVGSNEIQDEAVITATIADNAVTNDKLADNAVNSDNVIDGSIQATDLSNDVQALLTFLQSVPALEFGTSNSVTVNANSHTVVDITFGSTKTEEPVVFPAIQCATAGVNLIATVQSVTNAQCSICVTNLGTTDVSGVTVDYLAISGR